MKRLNFYPTLFITAFIVFSIINTFIISKVDPYEFGQLVVGLISFVGILIIVIVSIFIYETSLAIKKDKFDFDNNNNSDYSKNRRLKRVLLIIFFVILFIFFFIRLLFSVCWKEAFYLQKQGVCQDQLDTMMGYGKKDLEKAEADKQAGLIKENYSIITLDSTNVTSNSATLNGKIVNSVNDIPLYGFPYFRYGVSKEKLYKESELYWHYTNGSYSVKIDNLLPNTKYYYQSLVFFREAKDSSDMIKSDVILSFITLP